MERLSRREGIRRGRQLLCERRRYGRVPADELELLQSAELRREGLRRWSLGFFQDRYSLNSHV